LPVIVCIPLFLAINLFGQASLDSTAEAKIPATVLPVAAPDQALEAPPRAEPTAGQVDQELAARRSEEEGLDRMIKALKFKESAPNRFAADLFDVRQRGIALTEGGISDDYVLGVGDKLQLNLYGSANVSLPVQVDGRGTIPIPRIGPIRVGGIELGKARQMVQSKVNQALARSTVDLEVIKLREIRVFVLGEVYKPGSFLVPSLSSLVNVLSLTGGPTASGSFRDIRVLRGGRRIRSFDLYPFRSDGVGNPNFMLQSGDVVFVPLSGPQVSLEGGFRRIVQAGAQGDDPNRISLFGDETERKQVETERENLLRQISAVEMQLGVEPSDMKDADTQAPVDAAASTAANAPELQGRLDALNKRLEALWERNRGDHRLRPTSRTDAGPEDDGLPAWIRQSQNQGRAPSMIFELRPGEMLQDLVDFAGGILPEAQGSDLVLRSKLAGGIVQARTLPPNGLSIPGHDGDVVSAFPTRSRLGNVVSLVGWVRMPGTFARRDGMRVADLVQGETQLLPDSYLPKAELFRKSEDGRTSYIPLDLGKAMAGDAVSNLLLEDRDRLEVYRLSDFRRMETVTVSGPIARPGTFELREGMRASDLLLWAGLPAKNANLLSADLARTVPGGGNQITSLDLARLLPTEKDAPVDLKDDAINPLLKPDDSLTLFEKPDYRVHRTVAIEGLVGKPGTYTLDSDHVMLSQILVRAGGFLPNAMPRAAIFLRQTGTWNESVSKNSTFSVDPAAQGANQILERLSETLRQPNTGQLLRSPVLHGIAAGHMNRMVVDFDAILKGDSMADIELRNGDQILIPAGTECAYVVGEAASPFGAYKLEKGDTVDNLLARAGGLTRNADTSNIRLLKANGLILDSHVRGKGVEAGDTILIPQRIKRDTSWQENMTALIPMALLLNAFK
jgi:protein involved in polysaccharide export with SLBB domain